MYLPILSIFQPVRFTVKLYLVKACRVCGNFPSFPSKTSDLHEFKWAIFLRRSVMGLTCNCAMGPLVVGIGSVAPARCCPPTPTSSQMENWRSLKTPFDVRCPVPRMVLWLMEENQIVHNPFMDRIINISDQTFFFLFRYIIRMMIYSEIYELITGILVHLIAN
ncbi:uncharacterized protein LOC125497131 isoform X2 [Beta vulgaris subsp. vulgaris]|uniref:uncharacterized protein LOC125497131 isoform X2 n=1 Tax=Beta vulgaris subsp. vulgaris TaxID=3555 RepID=UPI0020376691|nr:uncharacterized protein LOC125497131 isoform X2 [Beta vulgaris subsp. vulgaris]XP_048499824.1 uncharacterized protein LOC125497131 isoform X2 [Beta vulgaris subsp. vulgaris]